MAGNLLNELASVKVPPTPVNLKRGVHQRINTWLLLGHLADVALRALPYALVHLGSAVLAALVFTITGKFAAPPTGDTRTDRP